LHTYGTRQLYCATATCQPLSTLSAFISINQQYQSASAMSTLSAISTLSRPYLTAARATVKVALKAIASTLATVASEGFAS
jgi:hypothetical protein